MIKVKNLTYYFYKPIRKEGLKGMIQTIFSRKKEVIKAVDDISIEIEEGEIVGYIGSNGAGKSTTIKMLSGILTPTSGSVTINGLEPYKSKSRKIVLKDVGVVFGQRTQLWWDLPLIETFNLYKDIYEINKDEYQKRLQYLTDLLDLSPFINSPVRTLSLGQRMRADLAAALIHKPKILFLDEPTIGLDVLVKDKIIEAIKEINKKDKTTILLTTHDMSDIANLCSRIIILDKGHIIYDGNQQVLKTRFGDIKHLLVLSEDRLDIKKIRADLNSEKIDLNLLENNYQELSFDANKVDSKELLKYVLDNYQIKDILINENSLTTIVRKIYEDIKQNS